MGGACPRGKEGRCALYDALHTITVSHEKRPHSLGERAACAFLVGWFPKSTKPSLSGNTPLDRQERSSQPDASRSKMREFDGNSLTKRLQDAKRGSQERRLKATQAAKTDDPAAIERQKLLPLSRRNKRLRWRNTRRQSVRSLCGMKTPAALNSCSTIVWIVDLLVRAGKRVNREIARVLALSEASASSLRLPAL